MVSGQFNQLLCSHTSVMELWLLVLQSLHHLANKGYTQVCVVSLTSRDLQYISIWKYIDTANKYHDTILYLKISIYQSFVAEQSVIALLL